MVRYKLTKTLQTSAYLVANYFTSSWYATGINIKMTEDLIGTIILSLYSHIIQTHKYHLFN